MTQDQMIFYFYERFRSSFVGMTIAAKTANGAALTLSARGVFALCVALPESEGADMLRLLDALDRNTPRSALETTLLQIGADMVSQFFETAV